MNARQRRAARRELAAAIGQHLQLGPDDFGTLTDREALFFRQERAHQEWVVRSFWQGGNASTWGFDAEDLAVTCPEEEAVLLWDYRFGSGA